VLAGALLGSCHGKVGRFVLSVRLDVGHGTGREVGTVRRDGAFICTAVVVVSAAINVVYTASHAGQHVMSLPSWQLAFKAVVIYAAPVVAAVLLWTTYRATGAWLLVASMAGSLVFGFLYHFLVPGADNVFAQPPGTWRAAFVVTAVLLSSLQATGVLVGLGVARRTPPATIRAARTRVTGGFSGSRRPGSDPR
jgi:hypothetical protein